MLSKYCLFYSLLFQGESPSLYIIYNPSLKAGVMKKKFVLALAMKNYFTSLSSLMILEAPPNLSMHQSIYRTSTQIVRFRSLSNAIL